MATLSVHTTFILLLCSLCVHYVFIMCLCVLSVHYVTFTFISFSLFFSLFLSFSSLFFTFSLFFSPFRPLSTLPSLSNQTLVTSQIAYLGLVENVRVRRAGYAFRLPYGHFNRRYKLLLDPFFTSGTKPTNQSKKNSTPTNHDEASNSIAILTSLGVSDYAKGKTKLFIKSPETVFLLEERREQALVHVAIRLQRAWRQFVRRRYFLELRAATVDVFGGKKERRRQSVSRGFSGDYIGLGISVAFSRVMAKYGDGKVLFADKVGKVNRAYKVDARILAVTDRAVYVMRNESSVARRILLGEVKGVVLSSLADDFCVIREEKYDSIVMGGRKSEMVVVMRDAVRGIGKDLEIKFADSYVEGWG